jgi:hypothetical protein
MKNKIIVIITFIILAALSFTIFTENTFLVDIHAVINQTIFHVSGEEQVIVGRNGWLYFNEEMPAYFGGNADTAAIDALCGSVERLSFALAARDIKLIILIAPNKNSIYPEYMAYNYIKSNAESTANIINERLSKSGVTVLDAFSVLQNNKENILYHKTDTHWNARGALLIYNELMALLDAPHETYSGAKWETVSAVGDLTKLYRWSARAEEDGTAPIIERSYRASRPITNLDMADIRTTSPANSLRLLIVRDSFGESLFPYIANNTGSLTYLRTAPSDISLILSQDAIVIEIVERNVFDMREICEEIEHIIIQ